LQYIQSKLCLKGFNPDCQPDGDKGIVDFSPIQDAVQKLRMGEFDFVYLPNTRWFAGEEAKDSRSDEMAKGIAQYADAYVNDAFGSWQPHTSTVGFPKYLPAYAGLLMQKEVDHLGMLFEPEQPLLSIVA